MRTAVKEQVALAQEMSPFAKGIYESKYAFKDEDGNVIEDWNDTAFRVVYNVLGELDYRENSPEFQSILSLMEERKFIPGGRYLYSAGRDLHQCQNCLLLKAEDSREGWANLLYKSSMALMTGAGIGIDYSDVRPSGTPIMKTGGLASGPLSLMEMVNECGRHIMQGGSRRSAIWAGLRWDHPDIMDFIRAKDWSEEIRAIKEKDFNFPARLDMTNISVILDRSFFDTYEDENHPLYDWAQEVYIEVNSRMLKTAEPGFSINYENSKESLRNACTEISSEDDSDICNLGSLNMANFETKEEFAEAVYYSTLFLLAGTVYSHVPYEKVDEIRSKNRRLGLGVMGIHEWLLKRGYPYEENEELGDWLEEYAQLTVYAHHWADKHDLSRPVKTRAIAPTGTIGIIAETTTGIEPIFCVAYKRRYLSGKSDWKYQYVVDPTAKRLIEDHGVDPDKIEDAYSLSYNVEKRIAFQAFVQRYVDHGISSTINLPYAMTDKDEVKDFADMLYDYLPKLRGLTCYPDGSRGGQPLSAVPYHVANGQEGVVFEESSERCVGGSCGV